VGHEKRRFQWIGVTTKSVPAATMPFMPLNVVRADSGLLIEARIAEMVETAEVLGRAGDLGDVLRWCAQRAKTVTQAEFAALGIFDDNGGLERFIYVGIDDAVARRLGHPPRGLGLLGTLARADRPLRLDDLTAHADSRGWPEGHPAMCAFLGVPIRAGGRTIGSIYMTRIRGAEPFTASDELAAALLALQAAGTVSGALAQERNGRLSLLEERVRIAHDLHDGTIQALYAIGLQLDAATALPASPEVTRVLANGVDQLNGVIRDMRSYIEMLEATQPATQPELSRDLAFAVRQIVPDGIDTVMNIAAAALQEIRAREAEDLLYIAREALSNAVRHGHASKIGVDLRQTATETSLTIQDNGTGFNPDAVRAGLGTVTMRTRAERVGAQLAVISIPGMGTTVRVTFPRRGDDE
jgi:signal transduction histidine kinase